MVELLVLLALAVFVAWGATISPRRRFSWAMYSGSTKAFLWITKGDTPQPARPEDLRLSPDNHLLTLPDLARILDDGPAPPLRGLIIGYTGNYLVAYDPARPGHLARATLPPGTELDRLADALRGKL
ncbi:MAG TPA: hypothetical protein VNP03_20830 [Pseudonocardia sp.]|nr:hypothetical protein [Pseudonocardia sp.]